MRHILSALLAYNSGDSPIVENTRFDPGEEPTVSLSGGPLPPRERPARVGSSGEQAAAQKRARRCLLRLVYGVSSGREALAAWRTFEAAGGTLGSLPSDVQQQVRVWLRAAELFGA